MIEVKEERWDLEAFLGRAYDCADPDHRGNWRIELIALSWCASHERPLSIHTRQRLKHVYLENADLDAVVRTAPAERFVREVDQIAWTP